MGGTWRENTYPGLTCDVPSHAYTYSFAPNPDWSQQYPPGPEISGIFRTIARDYGGAWPHPFRRGGDRLRLTKTGAGGSAPRAEPRIGRSGDRRHRHPAPPQLSRHRRPRQLQGRAVPQRPLGPFRAVGRAARRGDRQWLDRGADRLGLVRPGGEAVAFPAHPAMDHAGGQ